MRENHLRKQNTYYCQKLLCSHSVITTPLTLSSQTKDLYNSNQLYQFVCVFYFDVAVLQGSMPFSPLCQSGSFYLSSPREKCIDLLLNSNLLMSTIDSLGRIILGCGCHPVPSRMVSQQHPWSLLTSCQQQNSPSPVMTTQNVSRCCHMWLSWGGLLFIQGSCFYCQMRSELQDTLLTVDSPKR